MQLKLRCNDIRYAMQATANVYSTHWTCFVKPILHTNFGAFFGKLLNENTTLD